MSDSLRMYHSILDRMKTFPPNERITRVRNLALLVTGLYQGESIHQSKIAKHWPVRARLVSRVQRLRRFLDNDHICSEAWFRPVARKILARFRGSDQPLRLVLDTTKVGPDRQIASVSVAYRKRALPLAWTAVEKPKGHLDTDQILDVLQPAAAHIEAVAASSAAEMPPIWVLGDSEFGQIDVIEWVEQRGWHYVLRVYGHYTARPEPASGESSASDDTFRRVGDWTLQEGQTREIGPVVLTKDRRHRGVHLLLHWGEGYDDPWYLVSDQPVGPSTRRHYSRRMWTEELYGDLKGHGVDLQATRVRQPQRLERLVLGVAITYVWLIALGSSVVKRGLRSMVDRKSRRDKSYFRIGMDWLEHRLTWDETILIRFAPYL